MKKAKKIAKSLFTPDRRGFLTTAGAAALVPKASLVAPAITHRRKNYVLVHGTWHGGWAWTRVAENLRALGHRVITPTMTGCGERFHLIRPETGLYTHIEDVVNAVEWEEMEDVILVCHAYAGLTITGAADRLQERVKHLVYYDALIPTPARPAAINKDPETGDYSPYWTKSAAKFLDGYKMMFWDHYPIEMLVPKDDTENIALLKRRLTWHPARQWTEPLKLENGGWEPFERSYIHAAAQKFAPISGAILEPALAPGWHFLSLEIARNGFLTDPNMLSDCLAGIG